MRRRVPAASLPTAGVALAVAAGVVLRFWTRSPLWLDEALSVNISDLALGDITGALRRDGHPPLYYWLLHGWMGVFGDGDVAARSLSGVLSVAMLPLTWIAGHRLGGRAVAAWALVVMSLAPFVVRYATEARMYSLVMLLVVAGHLLLDDVLRAGRWWQLAGLVLVTGALLWTHYWAGYLLGVVAALLVWRWVHVPDRRRRTVQALAAIAAGGALFLPWLPSLLDQAESTGTPWALPSRPTQIVAVTLEDLGGGSWAEARIFGVLTALLVLIGLLGRRRGQVLELDPRTTPPARWLVAAAVGTLGVGAGVSYLTDAAFASRYAATVVPLLLLAAALGLSLIPTRWPVAVVAGAWLLFAGVGLHRNVTQPRTQLDALADRIERYADGDLVVVCPDQLGPALRRGLEARGADAEVVSYPSLADARFVDWRDYEARNDAADPAAVAGEVLERAGDRDVWLVWNGSYRTFEGDCELLAGALATARPTEAVAGAKELFENATLQRHRAQGSAPLPPEAYAEVESPSGDGGLGG